MTHPRPQLVFSLEPALLDTPAAARFLGISASTLWANRYAYGIAFKQVGRRVLWPVPELRAWSLKDLTRTPNDEARRNDGRARRAR